MMSRPRMVAALAAFVVLTAPAPVTAEPMPSKHLTMRGDAKLEASNGHSYDVPRGSHVVAPESWLALDTETRRLQDAETRLGAENASLRKSASEWRPGWVTIAATLVVGIAGGVYVRSKF